MYKSNIKTLARKIEANYAALGNEELTDLFENYWMSLPRRFMYVNAYEIEQAYGGPEEGGWWYDVMTPCASIPVRSMGEALDAANRLDGLMEQNYGDERHRSSVVGGMDACVTFEDRFAYSQPETRPHYE